MNDRLTRHARTAAAAPTPDQLAAAGLTPPGVRTSRFGANAVAVGAAVAVASASSAAFFLTSAAALPSNSS